MSPAPKPRPYRSQLRQRRAERTRVAMLDACVEMFADRGYKATTVADIAAAAGVAPQTVYAAGGKRALLDQVVDRLDERVDMRRLMSRVADASSVEDLLAAAGEAWRTFYAVVGREVSAIALAAVGEPEIARVWDEGQRRHKAGARLVAQRLHDLGALRPELTVDAAGATVAFLAQWHTVRSAQREYGWTLETWSDWFVDTLDRVLVDTWSAVSRCR